jgi:sporulation protein YlmC with PRC-barrel domain
MLLHSGIILGLPVHTRSNQYLGKVTDFEIDPETHFIEQYIVQSPNFLKRLWQKSLLIHRSQIISLTEKNMVVDDGLIREGEGIMEKQKGEEDVMPVPS